MRDYRLCVYLGYGLAQVVVVIGLVGEKGLSLEALQKGFGGEAVVPLAGGEDEAQRPAKSVADHMDLGGQTTSGTPQRLILGPPLSARRLLVDADQG